TAADGLALVVHGRSDGRLGSIAATAGPVAGPKGERIGDAWKGLGFALSDCIVGADQASGQALCRRPGAPTLAYVFEAPGGLGDTEQEPNADRIAEEGVLREFLWQAPLSN
ncbi:MAG TPA: hypothetical protein VEA44_02540, partial [Caulobacter sp.]|nr:hypothetical protein [Caulobacter sp.]